MILVHVECRYTCKWAVPTGGGTLGSKGIRANGARAAGAGPLITGNGGVAGVLSNGCLRGNAPATAGTAAGNRGADCCAILLLQKKCLVSCKQNTHTHTEKRHSFNTSHIPLLRLFTTPFVYKKAKPSMNIVRQILANRNWIQQSAETADEPHPYCPS